ncbi:MAG: site-specific integrase [Colwellia sp.]|nr:site-specific integrase [Colwellia sp.]
MSKEKKLMKYEKKYTNKNMIGFWIITQLIIEKAQKSKVSAEVNARKGIQLVKLIGEQNITEFSQSKCDLFMSDLLLKYEPSTFNDYRTILSNSFERAVKDNVLENNPFDNVKTAKGTSKPIKVFTQKQISSLISANEKMTLESAIVTLALATGVRTNELIGITSNSYNPENKTLYIEETIVAGEIKNTKTDGSTRIVDLNEHAIRALEFLINLTKDHEETTYDFYIGNKVHEKRKNIFIVLNPHTGKRFKSSDDFRKKFFLPYCEEVGVEYLPPKNLRHTFISQMLTAGAPITWIIKQVGHMSYEMIKKYYGKWINEDSHKSQELISDHFDYLFEPNKKRSVWEKMKIFLGFSAKKNARTA